MPFIVAFQPANAVASQPVAVDFPNLLNIGPGGSATGGTVVNTTGNQGLAPGSGGSGGSGLGIVGIHGTGVAGGAPGFGAAQAGNAGGDGLVIFYYT